MPADALLPSRISPGTQIVDDSPGLACFTSPEPELRAQLMRRVARRSSLGGSLDEMIGTYHRSLRKTGSWTESTESFPDWKKRTKRALRQALVVESALGGESGPILKSSVEHEDYREERLEISVTSTLRAEAVVTIPKNGRTKHPAVVLLHSLGSNVLYGKEKFLEFLGEPVHLTEYREVCYQGQSLLSALARAGFLCICIDALGFGGRSLAGERDFQAFEALRRNLNTAEAERVSLELSVEQWDQWSRALGVVGLSAAAVVATDDLRTVDYLLTRSDVDPNRIACAGLSFGSFRANYLAALDDRIKAAVSVCWISTLDGIVDYNIRFSMGHFALPPQFYSRHDMVDIILAAAPKPFLAMSGWQDILMEPRGIAEAHLLMRAAWREAGNPQALGSYVFDVPHEFNLEMQDMALSFLGTHLHGTRSNH